ncbi:hypothetical protein RI845_01490 [Thalassotalea nanhaiensis]|uniref:Shikimate kinase n=1 Tax=Thalassotalea nanhaiensis TaxID=3065648 RepID=A0ABY9TJ28_9GAMM|nr:hypothetical protein RI845_01490 [Colwelliaceae bacterium SQ345]
MTISANLRNIVTKLSVFQLFKYSVYILLSMNIYFFFVEDYSASSQTFAQGVSGLQVIEAFTATIDTAAWVVLLLLFELETYVLDDEKITGWVKYSINTTQALCYLIIVSSFYGYIAKYNMLHSISPFIIDDVCSLVGSTFTYLRDIDDYVPLTHEACATFSNQPLLQINGTEIIADQYHLTEAHRLSTVEVVNSATWLLVVIILEIEVYLQLKGKLTDRRLFMHKLIKTVLYSTLFVAAAYWGVKGGFIDFWDAFLWLVAFIFIELNIFQWNAETKEHSDKQAINVNEATG